MTNASGPAHFEYLSADGRIVVPGVGSRWLRHDDGFIASVLRIEHAYTSAYAGAPMRVVYVVSEVRMSADAVHSGVTRHKLSEFYEHHTPDSDPVLEKEKVMREEAALARLEAKLHPGGGIPEHPKVGSKWRNRRTGDTVIVKKVERSAAETRIFYEFLTSGYLEDWSLNCFLDSYESATAPGEPDAAQETDDATDGLLAYEADPPVTQSFAAEVLKNMRNELYATLGVFRKELLAALERTLYERERAEPVPDDIDRQDDLSRPDDIDRQDDLSRPDYLGPDRSGTGVFYTSKEIEDIRDAARDAAIFEATRNGTGVFYTAAELETMRSEERQKALAEATRNGTGVFYTAAELETMRSEERQKALADAAKVRAHFMLALQDAASALVDLGTLVIQGPTETNAAKRGGVAVGFRRAAHRIQHGSINGFADAIDAGLAAAKSDTGTMSRG